MKKSYLIGLILLLSKTLFSTSYSIVNGSATVVSSGKSLSNVLMKGDKVKFYIDVRKWDGSSYTIPATSGTAWIDIGESSIVKGITLYDDGSSVHGDTKALDGIYTTIWTVPEGFSVQDAEIKGYFVSVDSVEAVNNGYIISNISIDSKKPEISNLSIIPSPYNPEEGILEISFTLSEKADIQVEIYKTSYTPVNLVKVLTPPFAEFGDNIIQWDGYSDSGEKVGTMQNEVIIDTRTYPDGDYVLYMKATDKVGNDSSPIISKFKVSTVKVEITTLSVYPILIDNSRSQEPVYEIEMEVKASSEMLKNLGFDLNNVSSPLNKPYAYIKIGVYNSAGTLQSEIPDDLDSELDTDYLPNGVPNYVTSISLGDPAYVDWPDGTTSNDYDTLIPFDYSSKNLYKASFKVKHEGLSLTDGIYIVRAWFELVAGGWVLIEEGSEDLDGDGINETDYEKWNQVPDFTHYSLTSDPKTVGLKVKTSEIPPIDSVPPAIVSVYPGDGSTKDPEEIGEVYAYLDDGTCGSGVDLMNSRIYLEDSSGNIVAGHQTSEGGNIIKWILDSTLSESGSYKIVVEAVDKRGNTTGEKEYSFSVIDTQPPQIVSTDPSPLNGQTFNYGTINQFTITLNDTGSGIDWRESYISLTKDGVAVSGTSQRESASSNNLIFTSSTTLEVGDYTLQVVAVDNDGNRKIVTYQFTISDLGAIKLSYNSNIYLTIPSGTTIYSNGVPVSSSTLGINATSIPVNWDTSELGYISPVIDFDPDNLSFSNTVTIIMYYTDSDVSFFPQGVTESDLKIYGYTGTTWQNLQGTVDSNNNKITLSVSSGETLYDYYVIGYTKPEIIVKFEDSLKAYPQPVKDGSITFSYRINYDAKITIKVFNLRGEEVYSETYSEVKSNGDSIHPWNLSDKKGKRISSGLYFY
ncbi:MAG: hypothetical protein DRI22_04830, partial [Caldiserica bacterium]